MATDTKAAARSARAYIKRKHTAQAELAGGVILDSTIAVLAPDGHYVIHLYDGTALHLELRPTPGAVPSGAAKGTPSPKVYAPKSWTPATWNDNVRQIREGSMSKDDVILFLSNAAQEKNTPDAHKKAKQAIAVIQTLPDVPDWYDHLPLAEVS